MELSVKNIVKRFDGVTALDGVSLTARSGSPLGLLGRNGAGKTTLMRIIMNIFEPDSGSVLLDGRPAAEQRTRMGYLPEERGLYPKIPIDEQLVYFARLRGMGENDAQAACVRWLERLDMIQYKHNKPDTLSKGNQQRIQLALTLMTEPDVIILDEPFSGLDPVNSMQLRTVVSELAAENRLIIFSSHQMSAVEDFCDSIVILNRGRAVLGGSLSDIRAGYPHDRVRVTASDEGTARSAASAFGTVADSRVGFTVTMTHPEQRGELLHALLDSGTDICAFETVEPTLEEIFVSVAGDEPAQGSEGGASQ